MGHRDQQPSPIFVASTSLSQTPRSGKNTCNLNLSKERIFFWPKRNRSKFQWLLSKYSSTSAIHSTHFRSRFLLIFGHTYSEEKEKNRISSSINRSSKKSNKRRNYKNKKRIFQISMYFYISLKKLDIFNFSELEAHISFMEKNYATFYKK